MRKKEEKKVLTRAQKTEATKGIIKELLAIKFMRHNELIDEVARLYVERYEGEDTENINDVRGRVGSVLDIMKKESEVGLADGAYALKARMPMPRPQEVVEDAPASQEETPAPKKRGRAKKAAEVQEVLPEQKKEGVEEKTEEKPAPKKRTRAKKAAQAEAKTEEVPAPVVVEKAEKAEEKPAPKKRGRKAKAAEKPVESAPVELAPVESAPVEPAPVARETAEKTQEKQAEPAPVETPQTALAVQPKAEVARQSVVMDMSFLFGDKAVKPAPKKEEKKEETPAPQKEERKAEQKAAPAPKKEGQKPVAAPQKQAQNPAPKKEEQTASKQTAKSRAKKAEKPLTADEKLRESFLKKLRALGGDYFEYYSVYLLERYSLKNGRRLEGLRINGGDRDGGIDGEIELTDKLGFKETIYIQSKNWDPDKGRGDSWVVGETLLQQFLGACVCRQAKEGKQSCRGIFMTTSRFTPEAKKILEDLSEKLIGYDGEDIYEAAKECSFGVLQKNGEWVLDENLLSGGNAFFRLF